MKLLSDEEAINVLNTWIAFEVLSPQLFKKPSETMDISKTNFLPWENGGEKAKKDTRIHYHLILGTINLERATAKLVKKFGHSVFESPKVKGEAIMSVITLNQQGLPVAINFSSYAWGINQALNEDLNTLSNWQMLEQKFTDIFEKDIYRCDENGDRLPFNRSDIENAYLYINEIFEIPESLASRNQYITKKEDKLKISQPPPSPSLLNSFYLEDLNHAKNLIIKKVAPDSLKRYLGMKIPEKRYNVLEDNEALTNILAPKNIPLSRWPGKGKHSLVLLQQAAVNAAKTGLKEEGIFAVNGPPGTGKTTLLRDIVASILTDRAIALSKFDDPVSAFSLTDYEIFAGKSKILLYKIDESLLGFEILIASTNNKAVENISTELPNLNAISDDATDLRFFSDLANNLYNDKNWGIIAAVLGNGANRNRFGNPFWWNNGDDSSTFSNYLLHILGYPQEKDIWDEKKEKIIGTKTPDIIINNDPPKNRVEALKRWQLARINFKNALDKCQSKLDELENLRQGILMLESFAAELGLDKQILIDLILEHQKNKPNIFLRIFRHHRARAWQNKQDKILAYTALNKILEHFIEKYKNNIINKDFFEKDHADKNQFIPWCDEQMQSLRDDLFIQTMKLNKAFIDAAAKPLRHNIGIFMNNLSKQTIHFDKPETGQTKKSIMEVLPHVWASFFLIVSTISTTFASAGKMLDHIPPSAFGWLIIDEAGQAIPQAAVGALIRVKRAVVTGDPLQIEPIVTLPSILTENICWEFNVESNRFSAPKASVQTLADAASSYYAEFNTFEGSRSVGFPLLVHRRCSDPMFSISNVIAYERMMVQFKNKKESKIRECLGESRWFDVIGQAEEHWCPEEGIKVVQILNKIKQDNIYPDLYIITPFKIIAENLRKLITKSEVMNNWHEINPKDWIEEHIGTIHTVQGREADTVILVLGATSLEQHGTRMWAGKEPNILNVAVTRAKENLYVIGNRELWKDSGVFSELHNRIKT